MIAFVALFQPRNSLVDLIQQRLPREPATGAETPVVAEVTPTDGYRPIYIRAGETGIYADTLHAMPESTTQIKIIGIKP
jgi:hypothetical protein